MDESHTVPNGTYRMEIAAIHETVIGLLPKAELDGIIIGPRDAFPEQLLVKNETVKVVIEANEIVTVESLPDDRTGPVASL